MPFANRPLKEHESDIQVDLKKVENFQPRRLPTRNVEDGISASAVASSTCIIILTFLTSIGIWLSIYSIPFSRYYEHDYYIAAMLFVVCVVLQIPFISLAGIYWTRGILGLPLRLWCKETWAPIIVYSVATTVLHLSVLLVKVGSWPIPFLPLWGIGSLYGVTVVPTILTQIHKDQRTESGFLRQFLIASSVTVISNVYYFILLAFYLAISAAGYSPILQTLVTAVFFGFTRIFCMARARAISSSRAAENFGRYHLMSFLLLNVFELTASAEIYFSIASPLLDPWSYVVAKASENILLLLHLFESKLVNNTRIGLSFLRLKHFIEGVEFKKPKSCAMDDVECDMGRFITYWLCEFFGHALFLLSIPYIYYFSPNSKWFLFSYPESRLHLALLMNVGGVAVLILNLTISQIIVKRKYKRDLVRFGVFLYRQPIAKVFFPALCFIAPAHIYCQLGYHWEVVSYLQRGG